MILTVPSLFSLYQAKTLAKYKPVINVKHLPDNLRRVQEITDDALHFFNGTRLALVYYEDLVRNPKVLQCIMRRLAPVVPGEAISLYSFSAFSWLSACEEMAVLFIESYKCEWEST